MINLGASHPVKSRETRKIVLSAAVATLPFFLLIALVQWPYRELPFWGDSLGYMIVNTFHMVDNNTPMPPVEHDPGHPPLPFWTLGTAWKVFGDAPIISHLVQWIWGALLLSGMFLLGRLFSRGSWFFGIFSALLVLLHPVTFSLIMQLVPDLPMASMYVWTLALFYARVRLPYVVALASLALTKANAWPMIAFFVMAELAAIPILQLVFYWDNKRARMAIITWWFRWVRLSAFAAIPLLLWFVIHRAMQGFWLQGENFRGTSAINLDWAYFRHEIAHGVRWSLWWREGNQWIVYLAAVCFLVTLCFYLGRMRHGDLRSFARMNRKYHLLRSPWLFALSLFMQFGLNLVAYTVKEEKILRYFFPVMIIFMLFLLVFLAQTILLLHDRFNHHRPARLTIWAAATLIAALTLSNLVIRWHPAWGEKLPLPEHIKDWFVNDTTMGYENNLQIVPILRINRSAVRYLEDTYSARKDNPPDVVANYPLSAALRYPQGGYLAGEDSVESQNFYSSTKFETQPWDYYLHSPLVWFEFIHRQSKTFDDHAVVVKQFKQPENTWEYTVTLYKNEPRSAE